MVVGNKRKIWGYEANLIFQALFTKWHCEGCSVLQAPQALGLLAHILPLGKNDYKMKIKMKHGGTLCFFLTLTEVFSDSELPSWNGKGGKFVKQNFVILIPGGKMSEDVSLLHWFWFLPEVQKIMPFWKLKWLGAWCMFVQSKCQTCMLEYSWSTVLDS